MTTPPPTATKEQTHELARQLATVADLPGLLHALCRLGLFGERSEGVTSAPQPLPVYEPEAAPRRIGLWQPVIEGGGPRGYQRMDTDPFTASRWSAMERIPPKGKRRRILYFGESVARGFFFDPHYNAAQVIESLLTTTADADPGYEVIDLACNGQFMPAMLELAYAAQALQPEMLIFFAGNNWLEPKTLWQERGSEMREILRAGGGADAINDQIKDWLRQRAATFVERLAALGERERLPILLVLPEFNLLDFTSAAIGGVPRLAGVEDLPGRWQTTWLAAEAAWAGGDLAGAATLAAELIQLDRGTTAASPDLLARCHRERGDLKAARVALEQARDAMLWCWPLLTPRSPRVVRETILATVDRESPWLKIVDLPDIFTSWLDGGLPGRRLFFDYCHLTAEGTTVVAAAMVAAVLERLEGRPTDWRGLVASAPLPAPAIIGRAHLFAAMHNASWGQSAELVCHHAAQAAAADGQAPLAALMADIASRRMPGALCAAFPAVLALDDLFAVFRLADMGVRRHDRLVAALVAAFAGADPELPARIEAIRQQEYGLDETGVDLLEPGHHISAWCQPETDWWLRQGYFTAHTAESHFLLVCAEGTGNVELTLTCRLPAGASGEALLALEVSGNPLQQLSLRAAWTTHRL
ncbi:MAG: hypothetical protein HQL66_12265, partial [Magnetococcales bacterium]|nr:hypothetical protein [Magnetococcales bacterium]